MFARRQITGVVAAAVMMVTAVQCSFGQFQGAPKRATGPWMDKTLTPSFSPRRNGVHAPLTQLFNRTPGGSLLFSTRWTRAAFKIIVGAYLESGRGTHGPYLEFSSIGSSFRWLPRSPSEVK